MADDAEWTPKQDMSLLCRVCANQHDYLIPIFQGEGLDHDMPTKMDKHLPIKVRESDKLPTQMCYQCASTIIAWSELHTNCLAADKKLKGMLRINEKKMGVVDTADDDAGSDHYEDAYDDGGGGGDDDDEDFEKEIKQLISDAGVELGSKTAKASKRPSRAAATRKRKSEVTITPVKRETKKPKTEPSASKSSTALLKPKEEVVSNEDRTELEKTSLKVKKLQIDFEDVKFSEMKSDLNEPFDEEAPFIATCLVKDAQQMKEKHKSRWFSCSYCPEKFRLVKIYHEHLHKNHGVMATRRKRYSLGACSICGKLFECKENLKIHLATHNEEKTFLCAVDKCTAAFKCKRYLFRHVKKYHVTKAMDGNKELTAPNDKSARNESLKKYMRKCEACHQTFHNPFEYGGHKLKCNLYLMEELDDTGALKMEKDLSDSSCTINFKVTPKTGISQRTLEKQAEPERTYQCEVCSKIFKQKFNLEKHVKTVHMGLPNTYQYPTDGLCAICGEYKKQLLQHMRTTHTSLRPYTCSVCKKSYKKRNHLTAHIRIHTGEKPYQCDQCGRGFAQNNDMWKHRRNVHKLSRDTETKSNVDHDGFPQ